MRILLLAVVCAALTTVPGCAGSKPDGGAAKKPARVLTPDTALVGKVVFVNPTARYVVLNFPAGRAAAAGQVLNVVRNGAKIGELKVNALQLDGNVVADISQGEAQVGDQVKDR